MIYLYRDELSFIIIYFDVNKYFSFKAAERNNLKYKNKWLLFLKSSEDSLPKELETIYFRFDSDVKIAIWSLENVVQIYDVYNTGYNKNGSFIKSYYGYWDKRSNAICVNDFNKRYHKKSVLSGVVLHTSTVVSILIIFQWFWKQFSVLKDFFQITNSEVKNNCINYLLERKPTDLLSKFSYSIFVVIEQMHNFK